MGDLRKFVSDIFNPFSNVYLFLLFNENSYVLLYLEFRPILTAFSQLGFFKLHNLGAKTRLRYSKFEKNLETLGFSCCVFS